MSERPDYKEPLADDAEAPAYHDDDEDELNPDDETDLSEEHDDEENPFNEDDDFPDHAKDI